MQNKATRPHRSTIKPIHLQEAEFLEPEGLEILKSHEPRYMLIYGHMSKEKAKELRDYLNKKLEDTKQNTGSVLVPIMGRMV